MSIIRTVPKFKLFIRPFTSSSGPLRFPTDQHMAKDGQELQREKDKQDQGPKKWNEKLATHAEAGIRAEKDDRSIPSLQKQTVNDAHAQVGKGKK